MVFSPGARGTAATRKERLTTSAGMPLMVTVASVEFTVPGTMSLTRPETEIMPSRVREPFSGRMIVTRGGVRLAETPLTATATTSSLTVPPTERVVAATMARSAGVAIVTSGSEKRITCREVAKELPATSEASTVIVLGPS